ncbi:DNA polymerase III subunit gamma/tau [Pelistega sp. MC2]|uniref:DNA polymerase III subunit gamma/tau n=1 Tax=Pelistega sp. MC2 TaxID=1720297 RepID=UPI0008DB23E7|nr:DNA polymerase III subunit gamma/tau [Pelistega sp. MC2]
MTTNNYLVLARKWRPRTFETLVGQEHVVKALSNALKTQRLHHAWLFTGTRGVGKTTLARILAKSLNCEQGITPTPCGVCQACTEIDAGRFPDYLEFDAASNRGVEEMAQLLEQAIYAPSVGRFKIYTIDEVHMLSGTAFNAMLKTLEEPPPHVKFILATTDPQKIPVTVLSRCLQFNLKQMPPDAIVSHLQTILKQEEVEFDAEGLRLLAQAAAGSMRDALSLTDQAIAYSGANITGNAVRDMLGTIDQRYLVRFLNQLMSGNAQGLIDIATELTSRGFSFSSALEDLASLLSKIAIEQRLPGVITAEDPSYDDILSLAKVIHPDALQLFYSIAIHSRSELALSPDEYTGFIMAGLRMLSLVSPHQVQLTSPLTTAGQGQTVTTQSPVEHVEAEKKSPEQFEQSSSAITPNTISLAPTTEIVDKSISSDDTDTDIKFVSEVVTDAGELSEAIVPESLSEEISPEELEREISAISNSDTVSHIDDVTEENMAPYYPPVDEGYWYDGDSVTPPADYIIEQENGQSSSSVPESAPLQEDAIPLNHMTPDAWIEVVKSLNLKGMVGEIAKHSEWIGVENQTVYLRILVQGSDNLSAKTTLTTSLTEYFKTPLKLKFEYGEANQSVHAVEQAELQKRQQKAEQDYQQNTFVQALQDEFQAILVEDSIKPV